MMERLYHPVFPMNLRIITPTKEPTKYAHPANNKYKNIKIKKLQNHRKMHI
jgi:hypothetical protein